MFLRLDEKDESDEGRGSSNETLKIPENGFLGLADSRASKPKTLITTTNGIKGHNETI